MPYDLIDEALLLPFLLKENLDNLNNVCMLIIKLSNLRVLITKRDIDAQYYKSYKFQVLELNDLI